MNDDKRAGFIQSVKGKVIIASVLACFALLLAWGISKIAFGQMLNTVENISAPNQKLRLANELTHKITRLDQVQKAQLLNDPSSYYSFLKETTRLNLTIDSLKELYATDKTKAKQINSLKGLLFARDKLFINYLKVREGLVNNKAFAGQLKTLTDLVRKGAKQSDSTVTTSEKKTSTTTVYAPEAKQSRGFFSKLFGKKKAQAPNDGSYKVVDEELNVKHDTLAKAEQDSIIKSLNETMRSMEKTQLRKSALFVNREAVLTKANDRLIHRILSILKQVENEAVVQIELNNNAAKNVVHTSIERISLIMLAFFIITSILVYFIFTDIARSNRYRKELELARDEAEYHSKAKQRFLSNMSHEIRTPLQSIIGYAELIREQGNPQQKDIDAIYHSSGHLMQIVNEVLDYNRIISGKFTFTNQVFNMAALLDEVTSVLSLQAGNKSIALITDYNIPADAYLEGDPFRLKQILYNLLGNAIKFTNAGKVTLAVTHKAENDQLHYVFTIKDTGIGLSQQDIKRIFNEFEQVENSTQNHVKGTGLGLAISKALIESQGGNIEVESKPGKGSIFTFNLSFKHAAKPVQKLEKRVNIKNDVNEYKVWIIDDDTFILNLCSTLFENNNIPHRCFSSPVEMIKADWDMQVKYVLIDIRMPVMNGIELCKLLRKKAPADVQIYALTAQVMPGEREQVLQQGFNGILIKPFKASDLLALFNRPAQNKVNNLPEAGLDLSKIEKMTFGDKDQNHKILSSFKDDSINDIAGLKLSVKNHDYEEAVLTAHRIAGRTAQIGAAELATDFRQLEMELYNNKQLTPQIISNIQLLTEKLKALLKQIETSYLVNERWG